MKKLFINSIRQTDPGQFVLWSRHGEEKPVVQDIGNYLEVVLHRKLGVTGQLKTPGRPQEIRSYELVIHHSLIHGDPEMVRFDCPAVTVDTLLKRQREGEILQLRPVLVEKECQHQRWKWFIIAVDGEFIWGNKLFLVPHSNYEFLYGKGQED